MKAPSLRAAHSAAVRSATAWRAAEHLADRHIFLETGIAVQKDEGIGKPLDPTHGEWDSPLGPMPKLTLRAKQ